MFISWSFFLHSKSKIADKVGKSRRALKFSHNITILCDVAAVVMCRPFFTNLNSSRWSFFTSLRAVPQNSARKTQFVTYKSESTRDNGREREGAISESMEF